MITFRFGPEALAGMRFAISPLTEAMRSVQALDDPAAHTIHLPWVRAARLATRDLDVGTLQALAPREHYSADFVAPPPVSPLTEFAEDLARLAATPPEQVAAEVAATYRGRELPRRLAPYVRTPEAALASLVELLAAYWEAALAPHWPRLRVLLQGDVLHRARKLADGGAELLFDDIDPSIQWDGRALRIHKRAHGDVELDERGLLLVPSAFVWPRVVAVVHPAWQPTVVYPVRGVATLWDPRRPAGDGSLEALIGPARARILRHLDEPWATTDLARALDAAPSGVSRHLTVLRDAGLVDGHRVGRTVLYVRTPLGDALAS